MVRTPCNEIKILHEYVGQLALISSLATTLKFTLEMHVFFKISSLP